MRRFILVYFGISSHACIPTVDRKHIHIIIIFNSRDIDFRIQLEPINIQMQNLNFRTFSLGKPLQLVLHFCIRRYQRLDAHTQHGSPAALTSFLIFLPPQHLLPQQRTLLVSLSLSQYAASPHQPSAWVLLTQADGLSLECFGLSTELLFFASPTQFSSSIILLSDSRFRSCASRHIFSVVLPADASSQLFRVLCAIA